MILFHLVSAASWACGSKHMLHLFHSAGKQRHNLAFPSLFPFMSSFIPSIFLQHQVLIRLSRNTTGFLSHRRLIFDLAFLSLSDKLWEVTHISAAAGIIQSSPILAGSCLCSPSLLFCWSRRSGWDILGWLLAGLGAGVQVK